MRDLEFLPDWYPRLRRSRQILVMEGWIALAIIAVLAGWLLLQERNILAARGTLTALQAELAQSSAELQKLNELQSLQTQMSQQAEVVTSAGPHVPTARLMDVLDSIMPRQMALLDLSIDTETHTAQPATLVAASGNHPLESRQLRVRLHGVAPTDVDLGNFLARLEASPQFSDIAMPHSRDRDEQGHMMREFEVTFAIDLNDVEVDPRR